MNKCKIEKLKIVNFKTFKDVSFNFSDSINVLTGINNCGKTTVLEAIRIVKDSNYFVGPEGLLSFAALSNKVNSTIFYTEYKAVNSRILGTPWEEYATLIKNV